MRRLPPVMCRFCVALLATCAASCADPVGDPRPQLIVIVDTDAIVEGALAGDPTLAPVAALDTLRVDAIPSDGSNTAYDLRTFIAPERDDWPLSFGVAGDEASFAGPVRLRLRVFAGRLAQSGELAGVATVDPAPTLTIDRLIEVDPPESGIKTIRVTLREDCLGIPTFFTKPPQTCVDADHTRAAPTVGVEEVEESFAPPATEAGTWPHARELPCSANPRPELDLACVPGGFDVMGNAGFVGLMDELEDALPYRPLMVSPFWMDRTEMTVGRFRQMLDDGLLPDDLVMPLTPKDANDDAFASLVFCTWDNPEVDDSYPLNCVSPTTALTICEAAGGTLPSEAQWDHAASGRGLGRLFPWGDEVPECCTASLSRDAGDGTPTECGGFGLEPVGSHPPSEACIGLGDVSRDGILDLAGSVSETLRDVPQDFDKPCWTPPAGVGIVVDPVCVADSFDRSVRGGSWNAGRLTAAIPLRSSATAGPTVGFRCVYPDGGAP